ncbi:MAG: hypothetical protein ACK5QW_10475 [Cyanobacteriota bacterium]|jgi:hypothetical protein
MASRLVSRLVLSLLCLPLWLAGWAGPLAPPAVAAEILSVREPGLLRIGDQNRSYMVQLACLEVADHQNAQALAWMRQHGSRGTRVNIRPISQRDGMLVAKVSVLKTGTDLGEALVANGLASASPCADEAVAN